MWRSNIEMNSRKTWDFNRCIISDIFNLFLTWLFKRLSFYAFYFFISLWVDINSKTLIIGFFEFVELLQVSSIVPPLLLEDVVLIHYISQDSRDYGLLDKLLGFDTQIFKYLLYLRIIYIHIILDLDIVQIIKMWHSVILSIYARDIYYDL